MRLLATLLVTWTILAPPARAEISILGLKNSLVQFALEQFSTPGELEITAEGVAEAEDGATDIVGLAIADADGVWLTAERLSLRWNAKRILTGVLEISLIEFAGVDIARAPRPSAGAIEVREGSQLAETDDDPFDWPRSPITLRVEAMGLTGVTVVPGVIAEQGLTFDATGAARDEGDHQALRLSVDRTDGVGGRIFIEFLRDFAAGRLDLTLSAEEAAGGLVAELAGFPETSASRIDLTGEGPLLDWAVSLDAEADDVFAVRGAATVVAGDRLAAEAGLMITPGPAAPPGLARALSPSARVLVDVVEDDARVVRIRSGALIATDLTLTVTGRFDRAAGVADLALALDAGAGLSDLVEGVSFRGLGFEGALTGPVDDLGAEGEVTLAGLRTEAVDIDRAALTGAVRIRPGDIGLRLAGDIDGLRLDRLGPDIIGPARLNVEGAYVGDEARLDKLEISSNPFTAAASGAVDLAANTARLDYRLAAPDLAPLAAAWHLSAAGAFSAEGALDGPLSAPRLAGAATLEALVVAGRQFEGVTLEHDAILSDAPEGAVTFRAQAESFGSLAFDGRFLLSEQSLALSDLRAEALGAVIDGNATLNLDTALIDGHVALQAPDLAPLARFAGVDGGGGAVAAEITLIERDGAQAASFSAEATNLAGPGLSVAKGEILGEAALADDGPRFDVSAAIERVAAGGLRVAVGKVEAAGDMQAATLSARLDRIATEGAAIGGARLAATVTDAAGDDPGLEASLTASALDFGAGAFDSARLGASGRLSALAITFDAAGALSAGEAIAARLAARADLSGPPAATVDRLDLALNDFPITARAPFGVTLRDGIADFDRLDLSFPGGGLTGALSAGASGIAADVELAVDDFVPAARLADLPISRGAADLALRIDTTAGRAGGAATLTARDVRFADVTARAGALDLDATLGWDGRAASIDAVLTGPRDQPLKVSLSAPLRPSGGPLPTAPANGALSGRIDWTGEIAGIWALIPAPGHILAGVARLALKITGTVAKPALAGEATITDGRYENLDIGTILVDLGATTRVEPSGAFVVDLTANDGAGQPVAATVTVAEGRLDARLTASEATLARRDDVTAAVSLDITAKGPLAAPDISGEITIDRAEVRLVDASPPDFADLGPVQIKGAPPPEATASGSDEIDLDIRVVAPDDIFVRGRGLDSEWSADLRIEGVASDPRITGVIEKRRGVLNLLGRQFDLEQGRVQFVGAKGIDPVLNVQLMRENDGVRGGIAISGTGRDPEISFTSRPALPEEEVLPRVLFGRSKQSLSAAEALSLAAGMVTLLDGSGGATDSARGAIGIDVLRVDQDEEGDQTVTVGSNISRNVFVGAKQPIGEGAASIQVEVEVYENVTVDSEFGPEHATSLGLSWKRDF